MSVSTAAEHRRHRTLITRPAWLRRFEARLGNDVDVHPNVLSAIKLVVVTPLLLLALDGWGGVASPGIVVVLFGLFAALDYLDGVVAREKNLATAFGRVFDRVTDYPLLIGVSLHCEEVVPIALVAVKIALDLFLLLLFALGRGSTQNRLRTALSGATLLAMVLYSQAWGRGVIDAFAIRALLLTNIGLSTAVALHNLDVLRKRQIANLLSFANLSCGVAAIGFAYLGTPLMSLVMLLLGLTCDGFDGAAARRWGSTSWGVYSDDVADGVNFGLAPAAVVFFALGGMAGAAIAALYAVCTIGRLVYFTLSKDSADPGYFAGVPSPVGALIAVCAAILFVDEPAVVGLFVGVACTQMVSFATAYRHLGRVLADQPRLLIGVAATVVGLVATGLVAGPLVAVGVLLAGALAYTAWPTVRAFGRVKTAG